MSTTRSTGGRTSSESSFQVLSFRGKKSFDDLLNAAGDSVSMEGAENIQGLEHHQRQRALPNVRLFHRISIWVSNRKDDIRPLGKQQVGSVGLRRSAESRVRRARVIGKYSCRIKFAGNSTRGSFGVMLRAEKRRPGYAGRLLLVRRHATTSVE